MRILVTGRDGQLARSLSGGAWPDTQVVALGRPELDITDAETVRAALSGAAFDAVVNAAAYTAVDKAEDEPAEAQRVNGEGAGIVAAEAARFGLPVVHVSTDYVFAGGGERPYRETDATAPLGAYGVSKLAGEAAVVAANHDHTILRTAWVYSEFGHNFLKTMLRLAAQRPEISVVADQIGSPTYAADLAAGIVAACRAIVSGRSDPAWRGVFHLTCAGTCSWADFAAAIFEESARRGGPSARVKRIATAEFPTRARRPAYSVLDTARFTGTFGYEPPPWRSGIGRCLDRLDAIARP